MSLLAPIGLIGLLGIVALILIYIIRPNYQQKQISSTYIWKLSLRYRRKRIPVSKLNNVLIFLCQFLALAICAMSLAKPVLPFERVFYENERVVVIDASASMLVGDGFQTRFERAVEEAKLAVEETLEENGRITVILANDEATAIVQRATKSTYDDVMDTMDSLLFTDARAFTYGSADINGAMDLVSDVLAQNSDAEILFYTATNYVNTGIVNKIDMSRPGEWNAAVLNVEVGMDFDNHYNVTVDVGCFGVTESLTVTCDVYSPNGATDTKLIAHQTIGFDPTNPRQTVTFTQDDFDKTALYSFDYMCVYVENVDTFIEDNRFYVYGGQKTPIRTQYASSLSNVFVGSALRAMREEYSEHYSVYVSQLPSGNKGATKGFDLYVFEHSMPDVLPTDGVSILINPDKAPEGAGFTVGSLQSVDEQTRLANASTHPIVQGIDGDYITINNYHDLEFEENSNYETLLSYGGDPILLVRDDGDAKVVLFNLNLNYSNLAVSLYFPMLIKNIIDYFMPPTFTEYVYEIGDTVTLHQRGQNLTLTTPDGDLAFAQDPAQHVVVTPGSYTVTQLGLDMETNVMESFFVRVPNTESEITRLVTALPELSVDQTYVKGYDDLLVWFAAGLVFLLFVEWLLQAKANY